MSEWGMSREQVTYAGNVAAGLARLAERMTADETLTREVLFILDETPKRHVIDTVLQPLVLVSVDAWDCLFVERRQTPGRGLPSAIPGILPAVRALRVARFRPGPGPPPALVHLHGTAGCESGDCL